MVEPPFSVSFRGCSWLMIYHLGVLDVFRHHQDTSTWRFAGASSGAVAAAVAATGIPVEAAKEWLVGMAEEAGRRRFGPAGRMTRYVRGGLEHLLPQDAHIRASGRLLVSLTRLPRFDSVLVDDYASREELIKALLASCYIPLYYERPAFFRRRLCVDGGITENCPRFDARTITVSARPGDYDVRPEQWISRREGFFPSDRERLGQLFELGQACASSWLATSGQSLLQDSRIGPVLAAPGQGLSLRGLRGRSRTSP